MKKRLMTILLAIAMFYSGQSQGPLTGVKSIPGDYPKLESAIYDLNTYGVGPGGVIFNVAANIRDTLSSSTACHIETSGTGTEANPIIFQRSGIGNNPVIVAGTGSQALKDGIIVLNGVRYVTFDGIDLEDNSTNTTQIMQMEFGYALLRSVTQGSSHITIRNCNIKLSGFRGSCIGSDIRRYSDWLIVQPTTILGTNSFNSFYNNTLSDCENGIALIGYNAPSPYTLRDQFNSIGGDNLTPGDLGNTLTRWAKYGFWTTYQGDLTVSGNIIYGNNASGQQCSGFYLTQADNANYTCHDNVVSVDIQTTANGLFQAIYADMGSNGTTNTTSFYNNSVTNCTVGNNVTTLYLIYVRGGYQNTIHDNTVENISLGSPTAPYPGGLSAMNLGSSQSAAGGTTTVYNNICNNIERMVTLPPADPGYLSYLFQLNTNNGTTTCFNNQVTNVENQAIGQLQGFSINVGPGTLQFYDNSLSDVSTYGDFRAMYFGSTADKHIFRNKLQNLTTFGATNILYGIYSQSSATNTHYLYNNFVSELFAPNSNSTSALLGAYLVSGKNSLFNNTIYLNGTTTSTTNFGAHGIYIGSNANNLVDLRNNIVVNTSSHLGTGVTSAFRLHASATLPITSVYLNTSNNNNFYAGTPATGNYIFFQSTTVSDTTLADFQTRVSPTDNHSISELPPFQNSVSQPYDLHLKVTEPTLCESGGVTVSTPFSITTDYDNEPRYPNAGYPENILSPATATDIGADEFGGLKWIPPVVTVQNVTISGGHDTCFNATQTVTIAGNNSTFLVEAGGSATVIAGQAILFLPGTQVTPGGYLLGKIANGYEYCQQVAPGMVATKSSPEENPMPIQNTTYKLYPNPTTGEFVLEQTGNEPFSPVQVDIVSIRGDKVSEGNLTEQKSVRFNLSGRPTGIYFLRVQNGNSSEVIKIVKL